MNGIPIVFDLGPANSDERKAAEAVIDYFSFCDFFAEKGFLGFKWLTQIFDQTNNLIWTPRRSNQKVQNAKNIERLLTKTILGLCTRVIMKMTSHLLRHLLRIDFNVNVQTFEAIPAF
jgi:hypothetical protein